MDAKIVSLSHLQCGRCGETPTHLIQIRDGGQATLDIEETAKDYLRDGPPAAFIVRDAVDEPIAVIVGSCAACAAELHQMAEDEDETSKDE